MNGTARTITQRFLVGAVVCTAAVLPVWAESDRSVEITAPVVAPLGEGATIVVTYRNAGPDPVLHGYVNAFIPSGVPARLDELTIEQFLDLEESADDQHGNTPVLFIEPRSCEGLVFQLQGPRPPDPIVGLETPGSSGSFSFNLTLPEDLPTFGKLIITDPPSLAKEYGPAILLHDLYFDTRPRYAPGLDCNANFGDCTDLDSCFGAKLALMDPVTANLQLVSSAASEDPSFGCGSLDGFAPGRIAVIRRGECSFFTKAYYAQASGAAGAILVNDGRCEWLGPDSPDCVLPMSGGGAAFLVDIPVVMLSSRDGEALIAELVGGGSVTATMGAVPGGDFHLSAEIFSTDVNEPDPDPSNDGDVVRVAVGEFSDGFDCGTCSGWTMVWSH